MKIDTSRANVTGSLILFSLFAYIFFNFDDITSLESLRSARTKNQPLIAVLYVLGKNEWGYNFCKGSFLLLALYALWRLILELRK